MTAAAAPRPHDPLPTLVSAEWLQEQLAAAPASIKILDATWYMPAQQRNARAEFAAERIPTARFFDVDKIADLSSQLPHMLPSPAQVPV
jgi:thiosulfate/3-mercaptopyruvate sulfurtransferase